MNEWGVRDVEGNVGMEGNDVGMKDVKKSMKEGL